MTGLVPSMVVSLANLAKAYYAEFREKLRITDGFRSMREQQVQYDRYQAELAYYNKYGPDIFFEKYGKKKPVDAARPSRTAPHLTGMAVDLVGNIPNSDQKLRWLAANAPSYGLYQQLPETDPVHFIPKGLSAVASRRDFLGINDKGQLINPEARAYTLIS
jgi:LAS superfamily LD-carboxypeptidase LdcB